MENFYDAIIAVLFYFDAPYQRETKAATVA